MLSTWATRACYAAVLVGAPSSYSLTNPLNDHRLSATTLRPLAIASLEQARKNLRMTIHKYDVPSPPLSPTQSSHIDADELNFATFSEILRLATAAAEENQERERLGPTSMFGNAASFAFEPNSSYHV